MAGWTGWLLAWLAGWLAALKRTMSVTMLATHLALSAAAGGHTCVTDEDCNLNGLCESGTCHCVPEWSGPDCGVLNLDPARPSPHSGYDEPHTSSWGGSIVHDGGMYHMFVSRINGSCGLQAWQQNSEIIHATSHDPQGPYKYNSTVLPVFAHGPSVRRTRRGFLLMHLGCGVPFVPYIGDCVNGSTPKGQGGSGGKGGAGCTQFNVSVMTATSIWGPWSSSTQVFLSSGSQSPSWFVTAGGRQFSNPAPHVNNDGSLACAYRADARTGGEHVSVAYAPSATGPYIDTRPRPAVNHTGEE